MGNIVLETYLVILSVILPMLFMWIIKILKNQTQERSSNSKGTMLLLRVQLIEYHDKWMKCGYVSKTGLETFIEMYECYSCLGGNGLISSLKKDVENLPIR